MNERVTNIELSVAYATQYLKLINVDMDVHIPLGSSGSWLIFALFSHIIDSCGRFLDAPGRIDLRPSMTIVSVWFEIY